MAERLRNLCLDKICLNLNLYLKLYKYLKYEIPESIYKSIYENSFTVLSNFSDEDLRFFFNRETRNVKEINLLCKQFEKIDNYDFLSGVNLYKFSMCEDTKFVFSSNKRPILIKNLIIYKKRHYFMDNEFNLEILLKNCKVTESINFSSSKTAAFSKFNKEICFKSLDKNITAIHLLNVPLDSNSFVQLLLSLKEKKSLLELGFFLETHKQIKIDSHKFKYYFGYIPDSIKKFSLKILNMNLSDIYIFLPLLIKRLKNLEEFFLHYMPSNESIAVQIIQSLKINRSKSLMELNLKFERISKLINDELSSLINECSNLKRIFIESDKDISKPLQTKIIYSLNTPIESIEDWKINILKNYGLQKNFDKILPNLCNLKIFDLDYYKKLRVADECLIKILQSTSNSIQICKLDDDFSDFLCKKLPYRSFSMLAELYLTDINFDQKIHENFFENLKDGNAGRNLNIFKMENCNLCIGMSTSVGNFFSSCYFLEKIFLIKNLVLDENGFIYIISGLEACRENLKYLTFNLDKFSQTEGQMLLNYLKSCYNIRRLRILGYHYNKAQLCPIVLLESLKNSKKSLEILHIINFSDSQKSIQDFKEILKTFCKIYNLMYVVSFGGEVFSDST